MARQKYKEEFNDRLFLEQLVSLDEVEEEQIRFLRESHSKKTIAEFLEEQVRGIKL